VNFYLSRRISMLRPEILGDESGFTLSKVIANHVMEFLERDWTLLPNDYTPNIMKSDEMFGFYSGVPHPTMNQVWCLRFGEHDIENRVEDILRFFRTRNTPHMWWFGESSSPSTVEGFLLEKGLVKSPWDFPAMAIGLEDFSDNSSKMSLKGVTIKRVETEEDLSKWLDVAGKVYNYPESFLSALRSVYQYKMRDGNFSMVQQFLALQGNEPIAISALYLANGVAGIYFVGTIDEYQGSGIGTAITLQAMIESKELGYKICILASSESGLNLYRRIGFKEYYKFRTYFDIIY
jgi:ribosomal protein S18 acetylase RimI-like enzyme